MLTVYTWFLRLLFPLVLLRLLWRGFSNSHYWQRIPERFGFIGMVAAPRVIWIHAVSVGEVRATVPLVQTLMGSYPDYSLLITTMTPTGSAQVAQLFGDKVAHCYVPYDFPSAVRRFLDRAKPVIAIIMETELWPNLFHTCNARGIPVFVTNVRMSESSMHKYLRFARLTRATLNQASLFAAQSQADAQRLLMMGAEHARVQVTGSIKFELGVSASQREAAEVLRRAWGQDRPVWLAASTHEGEEEMVLAALAELKKQSRFANLLLVLVPRHPERFASVVKLCRKHGFNTALRSDVQEAQVPRARRDALPQAAENRGAIDAAVEVLVGDTMGELQLFFGAADVAFIGGSLVPTGGHNLLEASAMGKPAIFGPHMFNFQEISQMALERGAAVQIPSAAQLAPAAGDFLGNANRRDRAGEAGRKMVEENRGALVKTLELIQKFLPA